MARPNVARSYWFSDIESSTRMWEKHPDAMADAVARHDAIVRTCVEASGGTIVKTTGDGLMAVFERPLDAVLAGIRAQQDLQDENWKETGPLRIRIGMHLGEAQQRGGDFFGPAINRTARVMAAGHGGQILLSSAVAEAIDGRLPSEAQLRDLGEHRLKDLAEPLRLYQVVVPGLPDTFPPLATLDRRPNNLPTQVSVFLGREAELRGVRARIDDDTRLLTLIGPGGTGKTRLALQAAADQIDRFEDGLFFVDLAPERDANGVFSATARAIGLDGSGDAPPLDVLKAGLAGKRMLLLLDNFEQAIAAAPGLAELLESCPGITALVTSREALHVRGEQLFAVPPLSLPSPAGAVPTVEAALRSEAVRLFVERAVEARPDFAITNDNVSAVASICRHVDGLPLALELAAARLKLFAPAELDKRLERSLDLLRGGARDLPDRQKTLRNTIAWSYELLSAEERLLFEVLSIFSGTRLGDVERVTAAIGAFSAVDVLDGMQSLVDKSLLRSVDGVGGQHWFFMLETIGEYATERLNERPGLGREVRQQHAAYFADLARDLRPVLSGSERNLRLAELSQQLGNLREAWRYWLKAGDLARLYDLLDTLWALHDARGWYRGIVELADDLLAVLSLKPESAEVRRDKMALQMSVARALMSIRGYTAEVEAAFTKAMNMSSATGELPRQFPVLRSLASLYLLRMEVEKTREIGRKLLAIADQHNDRSLQVEANLVAGVARANTNEIEAGLQHLDTAVALFDPKTAAPKRFRLGPNPGVISLTTSALLLWTHGFPDRATERAARADLLSRELDHPSTRAYALHHMALLDLFRRDMHAVSERTAESLQIANTHDYPIWRAVALVLQGLARISFGEVQEGLTQVERGIELYKGETTPPVFWPLVLNLLATAYGMAGRASDGLVRADEALRFLMPAEPARCDLMILRGDLLTALPAPTMEEVADTYEQAGRLAEERRLRMPHLRAATRLARMRRGTGADKRAREALAAVYAGFTEGFDTPDLVAARTVLNTP
jgi:predicted ATPase/class 3 adenylate cyclase